MGTHPKGNTTMWKQKVFGGRRNTEAEQQTHPLHSMGGEWEIHRVDEPS